MSTNTQIITENTPQAAKDEINEYLKGCAARGFGANPATINEILARHAPKTPKVKSHTEELCDQLKNMRGRLTKQADRELVLAVIDHMRRMKKTKDELEKFAASTLGGPPARPPYKKG